MPDLSWAFSSSSTSSGTFYAGGWYDHAGTSLTFATAQNFGRSNVSYAAHFFVVLGAAGGATIQVTGTSINDTATRTTGDTEVIDTTGGLTNDYFETSKKWIGTVSVIVLAGTPILCDHGYCKYWDNRNTDYNVTGIEVTWRAGATDANVNLILRHHKTTGWTYTGTGATPPTGIASLQVDHNTEHELYNGEPGAWKRTDIKTSIEGSSSEGVLLEIVTTSSRAFDVGNAVLTYQAVGGSETAVSRLGPRLPTLDSDDPVEIRKWAEEIQRSVAWDLDDLHRAIWGLNVYGGGNTDEGPNPTAEP